MKKDNKDYSSQFPLEMPQKGEKQGKSDVIEAVVKEHVYPKSATNPAGYMETDSINTEFAKKSQNENG